MDNVKFSFQASMGCFGGVICSVNAAYCALVHAPNLRRKESGEASTVVTSRSTDIIVFQPVQDGREFVRQLVGKSIKSVVQIVSWYKVYKVSTNASASIILAWRTNRGSALERWSVAEYRSRKSGPSHLSSGGINIHEVLNVEMLVEQRSSQPSQSQGRSMLH